MALGEKPYLPDDTDGWSAIGDPTWDYRTAVPEAGGRRKSDLESLSWPQTTVRAVAVVALAGAVVGIGAAIEYGAGIAADLSNGKASAIDLVQKETGYSHVRLQNSSHVIFGHGVCSGSDFLEVTLVARNPQTDHAIEFTVCQGVLPGNETIVRNQPQ